MKDLAYMYIILLSENIYTTFCPKTGIAIRDFFTQIIGLRRSGRKKYKKKRIGYAPPHTFPSGYVRDDDLWKMSFFYSL